MSGQIKFPSLRVIIKEAVKEAVADWLEAQWPKPSKEEATTSVREDVYGEYLRRERERKERSA